jgi:hypothetical protein
MPTCCAEAVTIYDPAKESRSLIDWIGGKRLGKYINAIKKHEFEEWPCPMMLLMWATWDDPALPTDAEFWGPNGIIDRLMNCYSIYDVHGKPVYDWDLVLKTALNKL